MISTKKNLLTKNDLDVILVKSLEGDTVKQKLTQVNNENLVFEN